jgi:cysteine synthase A
MPARDWVHQSIKRPKVDALRSADTHLERVVFRGLPGTSLYLKAESTHPTGGLEQSQHERGDARRI